MRNSECIVDIGVPRIDDLLRTISGVSPRAVDLSRLDTRDHRGILGDASLLIVGHRLRDGTPVEMLTTEIHVHHPHVSVLVIAPRDAAVFRRLADFARSRGDHVLLLEMPSDLMDFVETVQLRLGAPPPEAAIRTWIMNRGVNGEARYVAAFALRAGFRRLKVEEVAQHLDELLLKGSDEYKHRISALRTFHWGTTHEWIQRRRSIASH